MILPSLQHMSVVKIKVNINMSCYTSRTRPELLSVSVVVVSDYFSTRSQGSLLPIYGGLWAITPFYKMCTLFFHFRDFEECTYFQFSRFCKMYPLFPIFATSRNIHNFFNFRDFEKCTHFFNFRDFAKCTSVSVHVLDALKKSVSIFHKKSRKN